MQWPDLPDYCFQFMRILGSAQEGASTIGECFLTASRLVPGDEESWHVEWTKMGDVSLARADAAFADGHVRSARENWLRAANYYRSAEFFLDHDDQRRLPTFDKVEELSHRYLAHMNPAGEIVQIPFEDSWLDAYYVRSPYASAKTPVVICFGGLDEFKDELLHEMPKHAFPRGLSLLLVDLPGQGGSLRRRKLYVRLALHKSVGACVDYLQSREDVDPSRIGLYGASLGGYYAPRAAAFEHRLACVVSDGAIWNGLANSERLLAAKAASPNAIAFRHLVWVSGQKDFEGAVEHFKDFELESVIGQISCPYLIVHGECDFGGLDAAKDSYAAAKAKGVDATLRIFKAEETGACHCQIDNPTLGQEFICDWLSKTLGVDETKLPRAGFLPD
jgi:prepilin-type processing-associated H-X9-DG protein